MLLIASVIDLDSAINDHIRLVLTLNVIAFWSFMYMLPSGTYT